MSGEQQHETGTAPEKGGGAQAFTQVTQTFTQADVDRIVGERVKRAQEAALAKTLQALGVDTLDAAVAALRDHQQQQASAAAVAAQESAAVEAERARAAELESALAAERQQRLVDKRDNVLAQALAGAQAIDADDVVSWLQRSAPEQVAKLLRDDGSVDPDGVTALVQKARTEKPHLFRPGGPGSPSNKGGEVPQVPISRRSQVAADLAARYGYKLDPRRLEAGYQVMDDGQARASEMPKKTRE